MTLIELSEFVSSSKTPSVSPRPLRSRPPLPRPLPVVPATLPKKKMASNEVDVILESAGDKKIQVIKRGARSPAWASRRPRTWSRRPEAPSWRRSPA